VLGFNFRGVMGSAGTYGGGRDELRDVAAAIAEIRTRAGTDLPTIIVGWSFGANVAVRAAIDDRRVAALALVGLPLAPNDLSLPPLPDAADLRALRRPALLLAGEHDAFAPPAMLQEYAESFPDAEVRIVAGTDHYFWRREREAAAIVGTFADRVLTPA
jgi:alpha/beta superfamily hydrolase